MRASDIVHYVVGGSLLCCKAAFAQDDRSQSEDNNESNEDGGNDGGGVFFNTMWPLVMILIAGGILIAVIVIGCRRCRPTFKRRHRRSSNGDSRTQQGHQQPPADVTRGHTPSVDDHSNPLNVIWTVEGTVLPDNLPSPSIHLKPPPYCENPPSYEDIKLELLQTKSNLDTAASTPYIDERNTICPQERNPIRASAPLDGLTGGENLADQRSLETNLELNSSPEVSCASEACVSQERTPTDESRANDVSASVGTTPTDDKYSDENSTNNGTRFGDVCNGGAGTDNVTFMGDRETTT